MWGDQNHLKCGLSPPGPQIDVVSNDGRTALMYASMSGSIECTTMLLQNGAKVRPLPAAKRARARGGGERFPVTFCGGFCGASPLTLVELRAILIFAVWLDHADNPFEQPAKTPQNPSFGKVTR